MSSVAATITAAGTSALPCRECVKSADVSTLREVEGGIFTNQGTDGPSTVPICRSHSAMFRVHQKFHEEEGAAEADDDLKRSIYSALDANAHSDSSKSLDALTTDLWKESLQRNKTGDLTEEEHTTIVKHLYRAHMYKNLLDTAQQCKVLGKKRPAG